MFVASEGRTPISCRTVGNSSFSSDGMKLQWRKDFWGGFLIGFVQFYLSGPCGVYRRSWAACARGQHVHKRCRVMRNSITDEALVGSQHAKLDRRRETAAVFHHRGAAAEGFCFVVYLEG